MKYLKSLLLLLVFGLLPTLAMGGSLRTVPNTFTAGTPAKASEVNDNFNAVKTAVDDNHGRISAIEAIRFSPLKAVSEPYEWLSVSEYDLDKQSYAYINPE